jgi:hypothetical protein
MKSRLSIVLVAVVIGVVVGLGVSGPNASSDVNPVPTFGSIPASARQADGALDLRQVPDFVSVWGTDDQIAGYSRKSDLFPAPGSTASLGPIEVLSGDGTTLVGHVFAGRGFVPLGTDPAKVTQSPVTTVLGAP